jgi:uncharacterized protein
VKCKVCLIPGLLFLAAIAPARADEASKKAKVEEFMKVTNLEQTMTESLNLVTKQVRSGFVEQVMGIKLPPERQKALDAAQDKIEALVLEALGWDAMKQEYGRLYGDAFSEEELDGMIAFYKSSAGKSMVSKTPALMARASEIAQDRMAAVIPQLQEMMRKFAADVLPAESR